MLGLLDPETFLREDAPAGDLTSEALGLAGARGRLRFAARGGFVVAGIEIAAAMFARLGVEVEREATSGDAVADGSTLLTGHGEAQALHLGWKAAQTLVEALSGLATGARAIVEAARAVDPAAQVACTRKTFPGARALSQFAAKAGGALLHRAGLSETILVFPEHLAFLGASSLAEVAARLRVAAPERKIGVELQTVGDARAALEAGFDILQLEKFSPTAVAQVVAIAKGSRAIVAAARGVNAGNAADYVRAGAKLLVTSAPYAAPPREVQVTLEPLRLGY